MIGLRHKGATRGRAHPKGGAARGRLGPTLGSAALVLLLLLEVASAMVGAEAVFFSALVAGWLVLPAVVGLARILDAGCLYMLVSLGIVVVVDAASNGPLSLLT